MTRKYRPFHPLAYRGLQSLNEAFAELQKRDAARSSGPAPATNGHAAEDHPQPGAAPPPVTLDRDLPS
jgi:hypothetical protein